MLYNLNNGTQFRGNEETTLCTYALKQPDNPPDFGLFANRTRVDPLGGIPPLQRVGAIHNHPICGLYTLRWQRIVLGNPVAPDIVWASLNLENADNDENGKLLLSLASAAPNPNPDNWFPAYFLPWIGQQGGAAYMTLPNIVGGPDHFFTSAISGCSLIVTGNADNPTVYHCGVENFGAQLCEYTHVNHGHAAHAEPLANDWTTVKSGELWEDLVRHLDARARSVAKSSGNDGYMTTENRVTTEQAQLRTRANDRRATVSSPWGAVCGVRRAGNWSFYVQKNVQMDWHRGGETYLGIRRSAQALRDRCHTSNRPIRLKRFFGAGPGAPNATAATQTDMEWAWQDDEGASPPQP